MLNTTTNTKCDVVDIFAFRTLTIMTLYKLFTAKMTSAYFTRFTVNAQTKIEVF